MAIAALVSAVLVVAGCDSGGQPSSAPLAKAGVLLPAAGTIPADRSLAGVHACALIPASTLAARIGQLDEKATESSDGLVCFYNTTSGLSFILTVLHRSGYEVAKTIAQSEARVGLVHLVSVSGGFAISSGKGGPVYNVSVAKGGVAVEVEVDSNQPATDQRANELVADAAARF